jgi:hypothetical protein
VIIDRIDEEFLLFALQPDGHWSPAVRTTLSYGLAASWLAELMVEGRLVLREGKVVARTKTPIGDEVLDWALDTVRAPRRPKKAKVWVRRLSRRSAQYLPAVAERLHGRGHVDVVKQGRKLLYPVHDGQAKAQLRDHLRMVLFGQRGIDDSSVALLAVLDGAGLTEHVFGEQLAKTCEVHIDRLLRRDHRFAVLREAVARKLPRHERKKVLLAQRAPQPMPVAMRR